MNSEIKPPEAGNRRRRVFLAIGSALIGLASGGILWMIGSFLSGSRNRSEPDPVHFGNPDTYPVGSVAARGRVVLLRDEEGFWAVTAICTHLGCQPTFVPQEHRFVCPCHGSRFDPEGRVLSGPATKNLSLATIRLDSQGFLVAYPAEKAQLGDRFRP